MGKNKIVDVNLSMKDYVPETKEESWLRWLGFAPIKIWDEQSVKQECYNCKSKNYQRLDSGSWTSKRKCNDCNHFTYMVWSDRMGGAFTDAVAVSDKDSTKFS